MSKKVEQYEPIMERESGQLIWEYYTNPQDWYLHNNRFTHRYPNRR